MSEPLRLLLVEDSLRDAELIVHRLQTSGFELRWRRVESESEYLEQLDPTLDAILCDFTLPQFGALEAIDLLKQRELDIPLIVVSGSISEEAAVSCLKRGASDYLLKDRLARLGPALTHALEQRRLQTEARRASRALRESELRYRRIVETALEGIWQIDADHRTTFANTKMAEMLATTVEAMLGRSVFDFMDDDGRARAAASLGRRAQGIGDRPELRYLRADGSELWAIVAASPVFDATGRYDGALAFVTDITERKRAENALARREAQLAEAQRIAHIGSWEWDIAKGHLLWSDEHYRIFGLDPGPVPPMIEEGLAYTHPEDIAWMRSLLEASLRTGEAYAGDIRIIRPDGEVRIIHSRGAPVKGVSGRAERMVGTAQDVTERKQAEEALQESERSLRALVGSLDDIVFEFDGEGTYLNVWTNDERLLALPRDLLLGRRVTEILGDEIGGPYLEAFRRVLGTGESETIEYSLNVGAGVRWFLASMNPVRWPDGSYRTVSMLSRDITERKQAEAERERLLASEQAAHAELRATQQQVIQQERLRALGQMASGVAHDFNNALSPVVAYTDLLLMEPAKLSDQTRVRSFLEMIQTAAADAAGVVRRLREFYRQREGDEVVDAVHLDEIVAQVISLTQFRWKDQAQARGASITISADVRHDPPVAGNSADLREALTNLIFNAVDAMSSGGAIAISTRTECETVVLGVRDTGQGMTDEVRLRCLEPFFTTKGEHGTGLGLGLVYGIVQRHQGALEIDSSPGVGTTVTIRLPIWTDGASDATVPVATGAARPLRVLVVEDEPMIRRAFIEYLGVDGHTVETASDGRAGLAAFLAGTYDLVLTDRALPEMSGDQVAAAIKALAPDVPIIMVTGFGDLMNQNDERPHGIDLVVSKPLTLTALRNAIVQVTRV